MEGTDRVEAGVAQDEVVPVGRRPRARAAALTPVLLLLVAIAASIGIGAGPVAAQSTATISGFDQDWGGWVNRAGAPVQLLDSNGNQIATATTSGPGATYSFTGLAAGTYTVRFVNWQSLTTRWRGNQSYCSDANRGRDHCVTGANGVLDTQVTVGVGGTATVEGYFDNAGSPYADPTAAPDTSTGLDTTPQSVNMLANDTAASGTSLVAGSTRLCDPGASPAQVAPDCLATSVTVAGVGTYSLSGGTVKIGRAHV